MRYSQTCVILSLLICMESAAAFAGEAKPGLFYEIKFAKNEAIASGLYQLEMTATLTDGNGKYFDSVDTFCSKFTETDQATLERFSLVKKTLVQKLKVQIRSCIQTFRSYGNRIDEPK